MGENMDKKPLDRLNDVAFITFTYNNDDIINSLIDDTLPIFKTIVVGDIGSTDTTLRRLSEYKSKITLIQGLSPLHLGNAKNQCLQTIQEKWILYFNPYMELTKRFFLQLPILSNVETYDIYSFRCVLPDDSIKRHYALFRSYCRFIGACGERLVGYRGEYFCSNDTPIIDKSPDSYINRINKLKNLIAEGNPND